MTLAGHFTWLCPNKCSRYATRRLTRKLSRSMPWIGGVLALLTIGAAIRQKGLIGGTLDTALDFIPFVGGAKNLAEAARGRDFIRDKRDRYSDPSARATSTERSSRVPVTRTRQGLQQTSQS